MKEQILQAIKEYQTIIIHRHVRPDPDALGSQGGLAEMIKASFKDKRVYVVGEQVESLAFLNTMDTIDQDVYEGALVIVCDTANRERVDDERYTSGDKVIKIDHHPNRDPFGDIVWVETTASSTSELIYELYLFGKDQGLILNEKAARLLYAGIVADTGRFLFPSTMPKTLHYAADLRSYPFDFTSLYENMYKTPINMTRLQGYILQNVTLSEDGLASVILKKELMEQFSVAPRDASQLVSTLGSIEGILAWVFFVEEEDQIRVRLRSKGPIINRVAEKYNGGGHPLASGATIYSFDEIEHVIADLHDACVAYVNKSKTDA